MTAPVDLEFHPRSIHGGRLPASADRDRLVDGTGSMRRLQALVASGRSITQIAAELGHAPLLIETLAAGPATPLWYDIALSIAVLFERWSGTPGPCDISRRHGKTAKWATPMAWYDIDIDDPGTTALTAPRPTGTEVDDLKVRLAMSGTYSWGRLSTAEREEVQRRLINARVRPDRFGELLKLRPETVAAYRLAYEAIHEKATCTAGTVRTVTTANRPNRRRPTSPGPHGRGTGN